MFEGFHREFVRCGDVDIHAMIGGDGPPVLLLHGYPETHLMWHRIAGDLARRFTVVCPDLRGYGDSAKPPGDPAHETYSKRAMALDQAMLMGKLGFETFGLAGHDRGARVARRLALDHPDAVARLAVLDIVPTHAVFERLDIAVATAHSHWLFMLDAELPEHLIGLDPAYWLTAKLRAWSRDPDAFEPAVVEEYIRCFATPEAIHATCEDYRAGASIDLEHDREDADEPIACPVLALWGARSLVGRNFDALAIWREEAAGPVEGRALDCGHFLAEEAPEATRDALIAFFEG